MNGYFRRSLRESESAGIWPTLIPLQIFFAYLALRYSVDSRYSGFLDWVLVPVHEGGHAVFGLLGEFMGVWGGSLAQWLAPLALSLAFLKRADLYAASVFFYYLGLSLNSSYCYMDSAFQMEKYPEMVFVNLGGGEAVHDWQYLFGKFGMYQSYTAAASLTRGLGLLIMWVALAGGAWMLWKMATAGREEDAS